MLREPARYSPCLELPPFNLRMKSHVHIWETIDRAVVGEFKKGQRENVFVEGDYQECSGCSLGRFVPYPDGFEIVECQKQKRTY